VAAGVWHDVIEKSDASASELLDSFGPQVTSLVLAVTEDARIAGEANRKAALRRQVATTGGEALMLFAADKLSKLRELASVPAEQSERGHARRIEHYRACLRLLERYIPEFPLVSALHNELVERLGDRTVRETLAAPQLTNRSAVGISPRRPCRAGARGSSTRRPRSRPPRR
jgi:hypothetical protein